MAPFSERVLPLAHILPDDYSWRITTEKDKDDSLLRRSIAEIGLLSLPILQPLGHEAYRVVTGFRRLAALRNLKMLNAPARLLDSAADALTCLKTAIADNAWQRPLNPGEQARAVYKLSLVIESAEDLRRTLSGLGLPSTPAAVKNLTTVHSLPEIIFDHVSAGDIAFSTALSLAAMDVQSAVALALFFADLKLGGNRQREALLLIDEISAAEDITCSRLLEEPEIREIAEAAEADRGRRCERFFRYLRRRRFPHITEAEEIFAAKVKTLKPGPRAKLTPPADFEGADYSLHLTFKGRKEIRAHMALLQRIADSDLVNRE